MGRVVESRRHHPTAALKVTIRGFFCGLIRHIVANKGKPAESARYARSTIFSSLTWESIKLAFCHGVVKKINIPTLEKRTPFHCQQTSRFYCTRESVKTLLGQRFCEGIIALHIKDAYVILCLILMYQALNLALYRGLPVREESDSSSQRELLRFPPHPAWPIFL